MDLTFTETEAAEMQGCTKVVTKIVTEPISSAFEYLLVRPTKIVSPKRSIRLCDARSNALAEYVSLNVSPMKAE